MEEGGYQQAVTEEGATHPKNMAKNAIQRVRLKSLLYSGTSCSVQVHNESR